MTKGSSKNLSAHWEGGARTRKEIIAAAKARTARQEGVGGRNAEPSEPEAKPHRLLVQSRTLQKSFVFLLEEKMGRAQKGNSKQNFSVVERALASGGGVGRQKSASGFSLKKVRISFRVWSQLVQNEFDASALRASADRLYRICQDFLGSRATSCESKMRFAVAKQRINGVYEPILFIPPKAESKAIIFNSPKAI